MFQPRPNSTIVNPHACERVQVFATYLKDQHSRVCDGQVDPHTLPVMGRVRPDAVHIQLPRHLQQLDIGVSR